MMQDSGYLQHFGRALAVIGARATHIGDALTFIRFAENAILVENTLHETYFVDFGVVDKGELEPVCHHYVHFLKSTAAFEAVEVAMGAVLPCFWIYKAVGDYILQQPQVAGNPYQRWINTYSGKEFGIAVKQAIGICDSLAAQTTDVIRQRMTNDFLTAARLEYSFWDAAYRLQTWQTI